MDDARQILRISEAFRRGDLEALREAVDDPSVIPNGQMPLAIGSCLVHAIYHSPLPFIETLLALGADPKAPADDGFPPLIAALTSRRSHDVAPADLSRRSDEVAKADDILRLLLAAGADPNQRGINDYTALHMAVAERDALSVQRLLDAGADADLRTRIDECETALEMAESAGLAEIAAIVRRRGQPDRKRIKSGLTQLLDIAGTGELIRRQHGYRTRLRLSLNRGESVRWPALLADVPDIRLLDDRSTIYQTLRIERRSLINGLFYGIEGMRVGGTRRLEIAPHLAYGEAGIPDRIPSNAVLTAEITILSAATTPEGDPTASN